MYIGSSKVSVEVSWDGPPKRERQSDEEVSKTKKKMQWGVSGTFLPFVPIKWWVVWLALATENVSQNKHVYPLRHGYIDMFFSNMLEWKSFPSWPHHHLSVYFYVREWEWKRRRVFSWSLIGYLHSFTKSLLASASVPPFTSTSIFLFLQFTLSQTKVYYLCHTL